MSVIPQAKFLEKCSSNSPSIQCDVTSESHPAQPLSISVEQPSPMSTNKEFPQISSSASQMPNLLRTHHVQTKRKSTSIKISIPNKRERISISKSERTIENEVKLPEDSMNIGNASCLKEEDYLDLGLDDDLDYLSEDEATRKAVDGKKLLDPRTKLSVPPSDDKPLTNPIGNEFMKAPVNIHNPLVIKIPTSSCNSSSRVVMRSSSSSEAVPLTLSSQTTNLVEMPAALSNLTTIANQTTASNLEIMSELLALMSAPATTQIVQHLPIPNIVASVPTNSTNRSKYITTKLFKRPCYQYLNDRKCGPKCQYSHSLPRPESILRKLMTFSDDMIAHVYTSFVVKNKKAFTAYFEIMCIAFGRRKMEPLLINAVKHCEQRSQMGFFRLIFKGFLLCGFSKRDALIRISDNSCQTRDCYDILVDIIIETDPLHLVDLLKLYSDFATINSNVLIKLLKRLNTDSANSLLHLFVSLLDRYSQSSIFDVAKFNIIVNNVRSIIYGDGDINLSMRFNEISSRIK